MGMRIFYSAYDKEVKINKFKKKSLIYHNLKESSREHHRNSDTMLGREEKKRSNKQIGESK